MYKARTKRSTASVSETNPNINNIFDMDEPFLLGKFISDDVTSDNDEDLELELFEDDAGSKPVQTRQIVTVDISNETTSDADSVSQIPTEQSLLALPEPNVTGRTDFGERELWTVIYTDFIFYHNNTIVYSFPLFLLLITNLLSLNSTFWPDSKFWKIDFNI